MIKGKLKLFLILSIFFINYQTYSQVEKVEIKESTQKARELLQEASVKSDMLDIKLTIRNADITKFPLIKIIVEASNVMGNPIDTLYAGNLTVLENNIERRVQSVEKISINERVPVDFMFLVDITGSMQFMIDGIKKNISRFTSSLVKRGIDYQIGLILFSDIIDRVFPLTNDVMEFLEWISPVKAWGGGDEKENSLEALARASKVAYRDAANRVVVLITDAPYHQLGEQGDGKTSYTTNTIIRVLQDKDIRCFTIVPNNLPNYKIIAEKTRGMFYDIDFPFASILDNFSNQLTNLYALTYRTGEYTIPDSIEIAILSENSRTLVRKTIPIVELGRKLILENLLFDTNSYTVADSVGELDVLAHFMKSRANISILIEGHTDYVGSHALNDRLSLRRAESVKQYLIQKGIPAHRVSTKGYGKRRPIADNGTEFGKRLNRRTEIVIIAK
ncbi:MAG: OmpA family protein [Ignavibacteria bacterium]|nr:OmpA family protein [Ignavibacteria bacterium]